jgi:hypothetical protein
LHQPFFLAPLDRRIAIAIAGFQAVAPGNVTRSLRQRPQLA